MPRQSRKTNNYHYVEDLGVYLPRVTSILNIIAKPPLVNWAAKTAAELAAVYPDATPEEIVSKVFGVRDSAGSIGTRTHDIIDSNPPNSLDAETVAPDLKGRIEAYLSFLKTIGFKEIVFSERLIWSTKYGFAGHADQGLLTESGQKILVDYKTGSGLYDEVGLQLVAYETALLEMGIMDRVDQKLAVQLNDNGTNRVQSYTDSLESFMHAFGLWKWKNKIK